MTISLTIPTIFWLADIPMPGEIIVANSFHPEFISLSSPSVIVVIVFNTLGYLSQLFLRLYLKFFRDNEESKELLQWFLVIVLGVAYVIPTFSIILVTSIYWPCFVTITLQFVVIPGMVLLCHENAHQYYFSNRPKLHNFLLSLERFMKKLFCYCLPYPQEPEPNVHESVRNDELALKSNPQLIGIQAATRLALAQKAHAIPAQYPQALNLDAQVLMLQNPQNMPSKNLQAPECFPNASHTFQLQELKPKNMHSMSKVNI